MSTPDPAKQSGSERRPSEARPAPGAGQPAPAADPNAPGVVRRTTNTAKRIALVVIGAFAALFAVFNSQQVEVNWIFGAAIQTPLILALAVTFIAGAAVGYLWSKLGGRSNAAKSKS